MPIASSVSQFWEAIGPFQTIIVLAIPVVAWLARKPVADVALWLFKAITKGLGLSIGDEIKSSLVPATRMLVVAMGVLIAHDILHLPEPYFSIVYNLLVTVCVIAVFTASYSLCIYIPQLFKTSKLF